jgi:hypothetical protein
MSREKRLKNQEDAYGIGFHPTPDAPATTTQRKKPRHTGPVAGLSTNQLDGRRMDYFLERLEAFNGLIF